MSLTRKTSENIEWQLIYQNWPGHFFILDKQLKIIKGSHDVMEALQVSQKEIEGKDIAEIYTYFNKGERVDDLKWRLSLEYIHCTGRSHKMNVRNYTLTDNMGKAVQKQFLPINIPIYDNENELRYVIHKLEEVPGEKTKFTIENGFDIISIINDGIYEIDFESKAVRWNDQLYTILGYDIGEIKLDLAKMLKIIHPEDRHGVRDLIRNNKASVPGNKASVPGFEIEFRLRKKTGDFIDVLSKGIISRNRKGEPLRLTSTIHDISNYKVQERIKAQLQLITDTIPGMVCYIDKDLKYRFVNSAYGDLYDQPIHNLIDRPVRDVVGDEIYQYFLPQAMKVLDGKRIEIDAITEVDGHSHFFRTWYVPDKEDGGVRGFIGLTMDVTKEKLKEHALSKTTVEKQKLLDKLRKTHRQLKREKDMLKDLFMNAPSIIAIHEGPDFVIKYLNKRALELYGDWIGTPFEHITTKPVYERISKIFNTAYQENKTCTVKEFKVTTSLFKGRKVQPEMKRDIFFDMAVQPTLDRHGNTNGIILYANDVTDQVAAKNAIQESAEKSKLFLEALPIIACSYSIEGKIEYANSKWYEYIGKRRSESVSLEEDVKAALHPDDVVKNEQAWRHCLSKRSIYDEYLRFKDRNGNYKWHHHRVVPVKDATGQVTRWIGTGTDVDDELKANEIKDEFIGIASHELKSPLTSVKAYIQLIQELFAGEKKEPVSTYLDKAYINTIKLNGLITELLDVSRIQSGTMELNLKPFYLDDMVKDVIETNQHAMRSHHIRLRGSTGITINGDRERLEQILNNLLSNAVKYSPGKNEVVVTISKTDNHALIDVTDYGVGISKHEQRKLFEQFYRAKNVSKSASGLGIGLYISLAIAKMHRGHITVRSEQGKGSTFSLILPRK